MRILPTPIGFIRSQVLEGGKCFQYNENWGEMGSWSASLDTPSSESFYPAAKTEENSQSAGALEASIGNNRKEYGTWSPNTNNSISVGDNRVIDTGYGPQKTTTVAKEAEKNQTVSDTPLPAPSTTLPDTSTPAPAPTLPTHLGGYDQFEPFYADIDRQNAEIKAKEAPSTPPAQNIPTPENPPTVPQNTSSNIYNKSSIFGLQNAQFETIMRNRQDVSSQ